MPARLAFHPAAIAEAEAARNWYAERSKPAAVAFVAEVDRAVDLIARHPDRWALYKFGTRRLLLRRFPFSIVFRRRGETILVLAVEHQRRRPGYRRGRL